MQWKIQFQEEFRAEYPELAEPVQDGLAKALLTLRELGPQLSRPLVDTLNGSKHANMKELRFSADNGIWRVAFAFDTERAAIILVAGDKTGTNQKRFYQQLIAKADQRFDAHRQELGGK